MSWPGLVILEGSDAVGKTTLANQLLDGDESGYVHLSYDPNWPDPNKTLFKLQWSTLIKAAIRLGQGKLTVIDRHWVTEQIYARTYRDKSMLTAECRMWDRVIQRLCGVYVICAPEVESAVERHRICHEERVEMYAPSPKIAELALRFKNLWYGHIRTDDTDYVGSLVRNGGMQSRRDAILYDLDKDGDKLRLVCNEIRGKVEDRIEGQYPPALIYSYPNFLGHPAEAEFLFVGERINPKKPGPWPFVDHGASSSVLSQILQDLNFDERRAMWTNAFADDQHAKLLARLYPRLKVVAFGRDASEYLDEEKVIHQRVLHPSYAKRFSAIGELKSQLSRLLA